MSIILEISPDSFKNDAQKAVFENASPNLLNDGPWGTGKTHCGAMKALYLAVKHDNYLVGLIRKKRVHLEATLWNKFLSILPKELVVKSNDTKLYRKLWNGSEIYGLGLDSEEAVNLMDSREFAFVVIEEAKEINEGIFDTKIQRCMRAKADFRQVLCLTNPGHPAHFLNQRFIVQDLKGYKRIQGEILPDLPPDYLERIDQLTGINRDRYKLGLWVAQEGAVYPYDPSKHLISMADLERNEGWHNWNRVIGVDFGVDHPFVAVFFAVSPSDEWYMYKEIYVTGRSPNVNAKQLKAEIDKEGIEGRTMIYSDHEAGAFLTFQEHGLYMNKAKKDRLAGQGSVYQLFEEGRIFFVRGALLEKDQSQDLRGLPIQTVDEFPEYVWADTTKEDMVKIKDDGMDAMRYAVHSYRWRY